MNQSLIFDEELIKRYNKAGPRYTSYPTAVQFNESFGPNSYKLMCEKSNILSQTSDSPKPLSLYFHIPFCNTVCFYCGCNKVVTKDRSKAAPYLARLHKEIALQSTLVDDDRIVNQLHWGGGTPTFLSDNEMFTLMEVTRKYFNLHENDKGEYSIELDPRETDADGIQRLRGLGFNRISLGVQDFDPIVQKAVNRIQSEEETLAIIDAAHDNNFESISLDLIYGLPFQTVDRFAKTLDKVIDADPDRLSVFNYAHLPKMFKPQRRINECDLPSAAEKLDIFKLVLDKLQTAGYIYIGMDHFAKPNDELAIAQRERTLYRNFQGYSTHADCDLIAMGITSIGQVSNSFSQNVKDLESYYQIIDSDELPIYRGLELSNDDMLRRKVISQLICHFELDFLEIDKLFNIDFQDYFKSELQSLNKFHEDGLINLSKNSIEVSPKGRLLIRNICMEFDIYLRRTDENSFSKVI